MYSLVFTYKNYLFIYDWLFDINFTDNKNLLREYIHILHGSMYIHVCVWDRTQKAWQLTKGENLVTFAMLFIPLRTAFFLNVIHYILTILTTYLLTTILNVIHNKYIISLSKWISKHIFKTCKYLFMFLMKHYRATQ